jgi:hypothetical protein
MSFWEMLNKDLSLVAHDVHKAAVVAKPHIVQAEETIAPLEVVPGTVGTGAKLTEEGLAAFSTLLDKLDILFQKYGEPPVPSQVDTSVGK